MNDVVEFNVVKLEDRKRIGRGVKDRKLTCNKKIL